MRFVWQFLAVLAAYALGGIAVQAVQDNDWLTLVVGLAAAALTVFVYTWVVRRTEPRQALEVAREGAAAKTGLRSSSPTATDW
ncbi:hypothetical protein [Streptomyces sp. NPDC048392]|uniref:hypothetical protein n=1 Tax=Streptomyces sp. NPDC048392 TaxID=3365543 RepID=UPI00371B131B